MSDIYNRQPDFKNMVINKVLKNPNVKARTFRAFASRQKGKIARVQFKPVRKKSKN